jgi:hypothetical protein
MSSSLVAHVPASPNQRGNPLIDGRGSRRRMRGRSDVVERIGVQEQGAAMLVGRRITLLFH